MAAGVIRGHAENHDGPFCADADCPLCSILFQRDGESFDGFKGRLVATYSHLGPGEAIPRIPCDREVVKPPSTRKPVPPLTPRRDRSAILSLLAPDRWITSEEIGQRLALKPVTVRQALRIARQRGMAIEASRQHGYRLPLEAVS